jgi:hypothetical protein
MLRKLAAFSILIIVVLIHLMCFAVSVSAAEISTELVDAAEMGDTVQVEGLLNPRLRAC